jgi:hypothetical protein
MATTLSTTIYEYVDQGSDDGCIIASASSEKVGFYGKAPVAQRAYTSILITSNIVTSSSFGTLHVAQLQEVVNILHTIGISKSA